MTDSSNYVPGVCNINRAEIAYRRKAMWFGITLSLLSLAVMFAFSATWWLSPLLFIPVYIAAIGYLQVRNRFCVSYGSCGRQNADDGSQSSREVTDASALAADKAKTRRMNIQAFGITAAVVLVTAGLLYVV